MQLLPVRCSRQTSQRKIALRWPQAHSGQGNWVLCCCSLMYNTACHHTNMADHRVAQETWGSTS